MSNILKYSVAIPMFAALFLVAVTALPASQQQVDAVTGGISGIIPASVITESEKNYVVHLTTGDSNDNYERHAAMMGIQHAKAFQDAGKQVIVFLDVSSPVLADVQHSPEFSLGHDTFKAFIEDGGRVVACQHCIEMSDVKELLTGVEVDDWCYMPSKLAVSIGTTVTWINSDTLPHTVTSGNADAEAVGLDMPNGFDSGFMSGGDEYKHTFDVAGLYDYYCQLHPWMQGSITVE